jgi:predicted nucleic acid-binding protein
MILLDTNVLSAMMQVVPDETVARWLDQQPRESIWITTITVMEIDALLYSTWQLPRKPRS